MPDWTYHPLSPLASSVVGERRTRVWAMKVLAAVVTHAGGRRWIPWVFDHRPVPPQWQGRFGATVSVPIAREAVAVLPVQGATVVQIGPVQTADVDAVRRVSADRRCRVIAVAATADVAQELAPYVDAVSLPGSPGRCD